MLLGAAVLPGAAAAAPLASTPNSDADLIALCARHSALFDAASTSPIIFDKCPAWEAYVVSRDAIHDALPATLAGMRAKALVAKIEARNLDGSEEPANTAAAHMAWDLVNDLVRLTGGAA
ncbi:MAG: hypothetical protein EON57_07995 [Alphaproteobacteria bacterium]|nr:MAG: hypothetical protein EON57_07995 [Alphaproteobacteria bacterium]